MIKKILIVLALLTVVIFSFSHENVEEKIEKDNTLIEEIVEVYNTGLDEINETVENQSVPTEEVVEEEKVFSVEISGELNTTKEKFIVLTATVKNADNREACNYFWSENNKTIDMGETLEMSFEKGEHIISVRALDGNGKIAYATVTVRAYDYYMVTREHYNAYYGNLEYTAKEIQNHKGRYLLMDDGTFIKETYVYDDNNNVIENKNEYYEYPSENKTVRYEYDEEGNRIKEITLNADDEVVYMVVNVYEDGNLTSSMSGKDEASLSEENYTEQYSYYTSYSEDGDTSLTANEPRKEYNDNGKITYEEVYYGSMKVIYEYVYDENDKLIEDRSSMSSHSRFNMRISYYDKKLQVTSSEKKYGDENGVRCHSKTVYTYNKEGSTKTKVDQLLEGECPHISEVKREYSYDKDGRIVSIGSSLDGEKGYTTLKVIKTYTNELEM